MSAKKILIIEDEPGIVLGLGDELEKEGYTVHTAMDGEQGLAAAQEQQPDLIVLDIMLPGLNGFEVCKRLRWEGSRIPILMLTARGEEIDRIVGLEIGADDYVTKPFSLREVVARIHAILRRTSETEAGEEAGTLAFADITIDFRKFEGRRGDEELDLTPREVRILKLFAENPNVVLSRDKILDEVWGEEVYVTPRSVDNQISSLRKKLESDPESPRHILSIRGVGYKFNPEGTSK